MVQVHEGRENNNEIFLKGLRDISQIVVILEKALYTIFLCFNTFSNCSTLCVYFFDLKKVK